MKTGRRESVSWVQIPSHPFLWNGFFSAASWLLWGSSERHESRRPIWPALTSVRQNRKVVRTQGDSAVSISFDLPASVEDQLRRELADLDVVAKEAALVELYRQGRLTHHQLGLALGLERHETNGLLKRHKVVEDLPRAEELAEQILSLRRLIDG